MAEFYRFFDSTLEDVRKYNADEFAEYFRRVLTNGIFNGGLTLKVSTSGTDMNVDIADGFAWVNGYLYKVEGGHTLTIEASSPTQNRIDRVVLRWDKREEARYIKAFVIKGEASAEPVVPALTRNDDVYELSLAQVFVEAGKSFLPADSVTDERLNTEVCGLVNSLIQADTTEIFNQFQAWYNEKIPNFEKAFNDWYTSKIPAYEQQWTTWYETHPPVYEKQWADWYTAQTKEGFVLTEEKGVPHGVATLDENGKLNVEQFDYTVLSAHENELFKLRKQNNEQNKEIAFLKLKQDAADRIEGGTTFADDIQGNRFGITFNEEASENAVIRNGGLTMNVGAMVENNVDDSVVAEGTYDTDSNGGRKLVRLDTGTLVCAFKTSTGFYLYKSVDNGNSWANILSDTWSSVQDICIQTDGKYIYIISCVSNSSVLSRVITESGGSYVYQENITTTQTALGTCSLAINEEGTELHACWSNKNSTYPNNFNIQYCKGVIGEGGRVTWGSVVQVSRLNSTGVSLTEPTIIVKNNFPHIFIVYVNSTPNYFIVSTTTEYTSKNFSSSWNTAWGNSTIIAEYSGQLKSPSAIFVPKSVNGLENGRIWVAWHGNDSKDAVNNIRVSYSDDNGVTWSAYERLTSESKYLQVYPSITVNKNNEVFVLWHGYTNESSPVAYRVRQIKWSNGEWGLAESVKHVQGKNIISASSLVDFNTDFTKPLFIYSTDGNSVNFAGSWTTGGYTPTTAATAVYNLPSTDYVGLFVQKEGGVNITATVNDTPMDAVLDGNEYQFTKALDSEVPVTLKLSLSRENTTNGDNDKVTRILGGIS